MKYSVGVRTIYYDVVDVEADSKEEAERVARTIEPTGSAYSDCEVDVLD